MAWVTSKTRASDNMRIPWYVNDRVIDKTAMRNTRVARRQEGRFFYTGAFIDLNAVRRTAAGSCKPITCNLRCSYCYNDISLALPSDRLELAEIRKVIDFAKERGAQVVVHAGFGEPLLDEVIWECLNYVYQQGMRLIVYTNGTLITPDKALRLFTMNAAVIIKRNAIDDQKQDQMVGVHGAGRRMWSGLQYLLSQGFRSPRLAIDSLITEENIEDIKGLLRFCRSEDILPYFETFVTTSPSYLTSGYTVPSQATVDRLFLELQEIDRMEFGRNVCLREGMRVYGVEPCQKYRTMFNVRCNGDVGLAPHTPGLGNIRSKSLAEILQPTNPIICNHILGGCRCSTTTSRLVETEGGWLRGGHAGN